jgi:protein-disulfide isomerase
MSTKDRDANRAGRAAEIRAEQERKERNRRLGLIALVVVVVVALATAGIWYQSGRDTTGATAATPMGASSYGLAIGKKTAPVHVVVYEDFQCPFCRQFEEGSRDFLHADAASGKVYVEYRPFAFLDNYSARSLNAFAAVLDVAGGKTALKYHDLLYDNQPGEQGPYPSNAALVTLAGKAGVSASKVQKPIDGLTYKQWVLNANDAASKAHVQSTPTVMVDGKALTASSIDGLVSSLESKIAAG